MQVKNWKVDFFTYSKEKGERVHIGFIFLDDAGVSNNFTLHAKAWRLAPIQCLNANSLTTTEV